MKTPLHQLLAPYTLPEKAKLLLSPFTPVDLIDELLTLNFHLFFYDTTLQGLADSRFMSKFDFSSVDALFYTPFFANREDFASLEQLCSRHHIPCIDITQNEEDISHATVCDTYRNLLRQSKDFSFFQNSCKGTVFPIFLEPQFFCPKEDIVNALKEIGLTITTISLLHKDPLIGKRIEEIHLFGATECQKSFIGLPLNIEIDQAQEVAKKLLEIMDNHSLRRCSF